MTIGARWYLVHEIFIVFTRITEKAREVQTGTHRFTRLSVPSLRCHWMRKLPLGTRKGESEG